ncbi:hypothetical protein EZS27_012335 [termite gut metagenome]|uniref:Uncharacterized protein n=1 Tax=termite gut metagenome TaxID=433724 RepID=A0A5J4S0Q4_9ZZZZ
MRISEIKEYVNIAYTNLEYKINSNGNGIFNLVGIQELKIAIDSLCKANIIKVEQDKLYEQILSSVSGYLTYNSQQIVDVRKELENLDYMIDKLHSWVNEYMPDAEDETTVYIKLPEIVDMDNLLKVTTMLQKAFPRVVSEIGGEVKIKRIEYGTDWVVISVGIVSATKLIMYIANCASKIAQKIIQTKSFYKQYELHKMQVEILDGIKKANEVILQNEMRQYAEQIEKDNYSDSDTDNERIERLRVAISETAKIIEAGGEIYPPKILSANESIRNNTPDYQKLLSLRVPKELLSRNEDIKNENEQP